MASTPPPPPSDTEGNAAATVDWRQSVLQSYRNEEVREIAKVLAALEPGATTSSKLMLAMRFEDAIFKAATSLADYRKKLTKRLKKLQKNYVPPTQQSSKGNETEVLLLELRRKYGDALRYIAENANAAVQDVKEKSGAERSTQLQTHTDSAIQWAKELGMLEDSKSETALSEAQLQKLKQHLERRVANIRQYVVKHADPDLFLQETLERKDKELPSRASRLLSVNLSRRIEQVQQTANHHAPTNLSASTPAPAAFDAMATLQESLEKTQVAIPPPTRNNSNDIPAALIHLDKMRAASTALMSYFSIPERQKTAPRNTLAKTHVAVTQGLDFVLKVTQSLPQPNKDQVILQNAWTKHLELPMVEPVLAEDGSPAAKRTKLGGWQQGPPVVKSRVLLTPNRKTPSNLIPALKRKRVQLIRPPFGSRGSHLIMEFGQAFTMTIYFNPLLVTLRAMDSAESKVGSAIKTTTQLSTKGCASWTPLYHGLTQRKALNVWGVQGDYDALGRVAEERLRDASMHATHMLRRCFRNHIKDKTMEFEVEILEASALLEFLHLARTTYIPNWQDDDTDY